MRQTAGVLNRIWLAILGIIALLAGAALLLAAGGQLTVLTGVPLAGPVITTDAQALFAAPLTAAVVLAAFGVRAPERLEVAGVGGQVS